MPPPKNGWEGTLKATHRSSCVAGQSPRPLPSRTMNPGAVCAKELKQGVTTAGPKMNVAKCDTLCELQNPANHRVFERKLARSHSAEGTSAWVSRIVAPTPTPRMMCTVRGRNWPPVRVARG
ncbi:hypothetical protein I3842_05G151400 [Carya illinoinensis]|uniref:Uncharacterized protein n=1 Tax=Carya illinoinensis TaxID=32201 RepID=A0A922JM14_CARIL|nr:hypothetical protein I3842_05G151400 [Carya illinoinensis]